MITSVRVLKITTITIAVVVVVVVIVIIIISWNESGSALKASPEKQPSAAPFLRSGHLVSA